VLHTPVTSAPSALAICTANGPPPGNAIDQYLVPRADVRLVAEGLQGGERPQAGSGRLLERQAGRLVQQHRVVADTEVLGQRLAAAAENLVPGWKLVTSLTVFGDLRLHVDG
jgi:hypothetical protein